MMKKTAIIFVLFLCLTKISVARADDANWFLGTWHYYQNDGTWLLDTTAVKNGPYYELRTTGFNPDVYSYMEIGKLVSRLTYDSSQNKFFGDQYRVENGSYYDTVVVDVVNQSYLIYEVLGQTLRR